MKNRISFVPNADFQKKYMAALDTLVEMSGQLVEGTSRDDMDGGQNMGTRNGLAFAKDAFAIASDNPKLIEDEDSSLKAFEADIARITFLLAVEDQLAIIGKTVNQAVILTGKDLMDQASRVLSELKKRKDNPKFAALYERLNRIYLDRQKRVEETKKMKAAILEQKTNVK
jgi:hypothetical protein